MSNFTITIDAAASTADMIHSLVPFFTHPAPMILMSRDGERIGAVTLAPIADAAAIAQHEEILAGLAGERAHSRIRTANGINVRWTYNEDATMAAPIADAAISCAKCGISLKMTRFTDEDSSGHVWLYCSEFCRETH